MQEYIVLDQLIIKLSVLLGLSLLIERFLAFLNTAINRLLVFQYSNKNTQIEKLQEKLNREIAASTEERELNSLSGEDKDPREIVPNSTLSVSHQVESNFDVLPIKPMRSILDDTLRFEKYKEQNTILKEFWMQVLGTIIAIIVCYISKFSIWEFFTYAVTGEYLENLRNFEFIFTGVIIGSGSKPINFLMNFLINRKIEADQGEVKEESKIIPESDQPKVKIITKEKSEVTPVVLSIQPKSIEEIVGFEYNGGDRPGRLENVHLYKNPIDLVIYHHTAMHSDAPFEEVVKEFDRKGWLTGYHCVVFKDGSIRVLCRWDRFGNHAITYNSRSFGIAFQGNFETDPGIPYSNPEGKMGIASPTHSQIQSAARVVAMYALMHNIKAEFPSSVPSGKPLKNIIPHNLIANKACPGCNFPHQNFQNSILDYHIKWSNDADFKKALEAFKNKPMVIPK